MQAGWVAKRETLVVEETQYAAVGGRHLAFKILDGSKDYELVLFTPGGTIPMQILERDRIGARLIRGLQGVGRLLLFDRRGIGLSDPIGDWSRPLVEQWAEDLATIIEFAGLDRPIVLGLGDYWGPTRLFAGNNVDALSGLVLYEPNGPQDAIDLRPAILGEAANLDWIARVCPSRAEDRAFREWFNEAGRTGASPGVAMHLYDPPDATCIQALIDAQDRITVPTLILRRSANLMGSPGPPDPLMPMISGSRSVNLPGADYHWLGEDVDSLLTEITQFITGESRLPTPERLLCAVMFTDIVGSTERASAMGDAHWKALLDRHDNVIDHEVHRRSGRVVKSTGDGVLVTFPSAENALRAASALRSRLEEEGLGVRIGIHIGDVERHGDDLAGLGVQFAARVVALAKPGEILVTASVPLATLGAGHSFEPRGSHTLRGTPGDWDLYCWS